jgi:protein-tyrosine-phosphatase
MAAALFSRVAPVGEDDAPEPVTVASAGLLPGGYASPPEVVGVMAGHCSTQVSGRLVATSDLVVGMARRHAREAVILEPAAWERTFTLKELVRRGDYVGERARHETLGSWLGRLHQGRQRTDLVGRSAEDDVADPLGGSMGEFRVTARELGSLVERVASLLWAPRGIRSLPG